MGGVIIGSCGSVDLLQEKTFRILTLVLDAVSHFRNGTRLYTSHCHMKLLYPRLIWPSIVSHGDWYTPGPRMCK
jgi:hypothetical protein